MTFNIERALLSDDDADRLYVRRPELAAGPWDYCPTCGTTKTYRWRGIDHECNCMMQVQLCKHYSSAGIGDTYQRLDWSDLEIDDQKMLHDIQGYLDNYQRYLARGIGLLLLGPVGTGKTMVANLVLKELIKRGCTGFATTFANTIEAFTSTWRTPENKQWFARKFMHSDVLLLDDLGRELRGGSNLPASTFDMILRTRVQESRPTILTSNSTVNDLSIGYGAQVLSLLQEQSIVYPFTGNDFREKANARSRTEITDNEVRPIV